MNDSDIKAEISRLNWLDNERKRPPQLSIRRSFADGGAGAWHVCNPKRAIGAFYTHADAKRAMRAMNYYADLLAALEKISRMADLGEPGIKKVADDAIKGAV